MTGADDQAVELAERETRDRESVASACERRAGLLASTCSRAAAVDVELGRPPEPAALAVRRLQVRARALRWVEAGRPAAR